MSLINEVDCKTIFQQLPISSWIVDIDTLKILQLNNRAVEVYGYTKEEFKKLYFWNLCVNNDEKEILNKIQKINKLKHFSFKTKHKTKNNDIMDVTISINIVTVKNKSFYNVACQNNTHELKVENKLDYFEKKFEYFFNQLPDSILIIDETLKKILNVNKAATDFFGYTQDELRSMDFSDIIKLKTDTNCKNIIEKNINNKQKSFEIKVKNKNKKIVDVSIVLKKLKSPYGINYIITCRDVTIEKNEEIHLKEMNKTLKKSVELKAMELYKNERILLEQSKLAQMGEMLNMIAHQWRQPLNSISTAALNLSFQNEFETIEKDSLEEISQFIQDETQAMSQIINDFMEFNKSDTNKEFLIYEAILEVQKMIIPQLKNRNIILEIDVEKELKIFHNVKSIQHVLLNIIMNARDAFENKNEIIDKKIKIYTNNTKEQVSLNIEDNAGGVPADVIDKVFNPYFTTKKRGEGTGIGLYMSKRMIENVEGSVLSVKNMNCGAVFSIGFKSDFYNKPQK